jgi:hypothetical protein
MGATIWIDRNQLGRRNLSKQDYKLLLGRRYNRAKKSHGARARGTRGRAQKLLNSGVFQTLRPIQSCRGIGCNSDAAARFDIVNSHRCSTYSSPEGNENAAENKVEKVTTLKTAERRLS